MPKCSANTVASMMCGCTVEEPHSTPSTSPRSRRGSAMASSAALLIRSSVEEPSCLPKDVSPTPVIKLISIRLRQAEHFLGNETQDQLRADRRDAGDQGFA